jgi:hypothetical protein
MVTPPAVAAGTGMRAAISGSNQDPGGVRCPFRAYLVCPRIPDTTAPAIPAKQGPIQLRNMYLNHCLATLCNHERKGVRYGMSPWLVWGVFAIAAVLLGWVGYHFTARTLRFVTAGFALAVAVLVARYGVTHPIGAPTDLVSAFTRGMDKLSTVFFQPLLGGQVLAHGRVGWLVIIAVLVFAYRELEVWAMRWQPPAVDTSALDGNQPGAQNTGAPGDGGPDEQREHDKLVAELRFRLPAVEVRTPPVLPGGATANGLASLAENSGAADSGLAGAVIRLAGMLWPNPRRYQVRVWVEPADPPSAENFLEEIGQRLPWHTGEHSARGTERATACRKVTVDLEDPQTGASIATKTLVASDLDEAAAVVAAYVARQIFKEDPTAPAWCVGSFDGGDLAALLSAEQLRVPIDCSEAAGCARRRRIEILEKAVCNSYSAGVARHELALLYDLERNYVEALWLHAINREQYSRFYRGRYRLGMSLEMIANPTFGPWNGQAMRKLCEILHILDRCCVTDDAEGSCDIHATKLSPELTGKLLAAARNEFRACRRQTTLWRVLWGAFWHRDERAIRKPLWQLRERQRFHDGAHVAELLVTVRQSLNRERCDLKGRLQARRAIRVTAAIAGDSATIKELLKNSQATVGEIRQPGPKSKKTRWLPWQRRTPSWQAAYNTACLYSALAGTTDPRYPADTPKYCRNTMARRAAASLKRVVDDRDCDMQRPSDWISKDPDFSCLKSSSEEFNQFLNAQKQTDYPTAKPKPAYH